MQTDIEVAAEAVLDFLKGIPMSASTVKYYRSCYKTINMYCQSNSIGMFSHDDAEDFKKFEMNRHEKGEIGRVYALTYPK